jgi:gliding motility-associated-like protein
MEKKDNALRAAIGALLVGCVMPFAHAAGPAAPFTPNEGQWRQPFLFKAESGNLALFAGRSALSWSMLQPDLEEVLHEAHHDGVRPMIAGHAWRMHFEDATPASIAGEVPGAERYGYFLGNDPSRWRPRVPRYESVRYSDLWPGIDLRVYMRDGAFKYDLELAPGADASKAVFRYEGLEGMSVDAEGDLVLRTSLGEVKELRPVAWYADGAREPVACAYVLQGDRLSFSMPGADHGRPIVIDPVLVASTLSGTGNLGQTQNYGHSATYDAQGNIYTGARCFGQGYPVTTGAFQTVYGGGGVDIAVSKLSPDGSNLLFACYLGGAGEEYPHSLVVDDLLNLWVYGSTSSDDYPVTASAFDPTYNGSGFGSEDIVISKLDPTGTVLVGSTYVGGNGQDGRNAFTFNYGDNFRGEIIVDAAGNAVVSSCTVSSDFPVTAGCLQPTLGGGQDGVVFSLNPFCTALNWSTFLGGSGGDMAFGVKLGDDGSVYVCGGTEGTGFPTTTGAYDPSPNGGHDAFVVRMAPTATSLLAGTLWGTTADDEAFFLQLDNFGDAYIFGQSQGTFTPLPTGVYSQAGGTYVAKFSADLAALEVQTTFGADMVPVAFLVDVCRNIYFSGYSISGNPPTTPGALYTSGGFYLAVFAPDMAALNYGTYYQGAGHVDGGTSRFDPNGIVYQAVCTSGGFPTTPNAYSNVQPAGWDVGVFKIDFEQAGVQTIATASATYGCAPAVIQFTGTGNAQYWVWDLGDGSPQVTTQNTQHTYPQPGVYQVMLVGIDSSTCNVADTMYIPVIINAPGSLQPTFTTQQNTDCTVLQVVATNTTPGTWLLSSWNMGDGTVLNGASVVHDYATVGTYQVTLTVIDTLCGDTATLVQPVTVTQGLNFTVGPDVVICPGDQATLTASVPGATYVWSNGATTSSISVGTPGPYWVTADVGGCTASDTVVVGLHPEPGELNSLVEACPGDPVTLAVPIEGQSYLWSSGATTQAITVNAFGDYTFTVVDLNGCTWSGTGTVVSDPDNFEVWVPNVFSPNGDGENDRFEPQTGGPKDVQVTIYNRWGMEMFSSPNLGRLWDGRHDGRVVPDGTYFYIVSYRAACNAERTTEVGHVTVLR